MLLSASAVSYKNPLPHGRKEVYVQNKKKKKSKAESMLSARSQILNIVFVVAILVFTFIFLFNSIMNDPNTNLEDLEFSDLGQLNWWWLLPALACLVLSVSFEAVNLNILCRKVGYKRSIAQSMTFASSDIYFSAITPSATGGQPAAAYYMTKSGVPLSLATAVLMLNVTIYTVGLLVIGAVALILKPQTFLDFDVFQKICVIIGIVFHAILIVACLVCMFSRRVVYFFGDVFYGILAKLRLVKNKEEKIVAFRASVAGYRAAFGIVKEHPWLLPMLLFNGIMQRVILAPITYFVLLAMQPLFGGASIPNMMEVIIMQLYCTVGASAMPLPGGMGIAETLFNSMFSTICDADNLRVLAMLLSRTFSSYLAIITCGAVTITHHLRMKRGEFRRRAIDSPFDSVEPPPPTEALDGAADADVPTADISSDATSADTPSDSPDEQC